MGARKHIFSGAWTEESFIIGGAYAIFAVKRIATKIKRTCENINVITPVKNNGIGRILACNKYGTN